MHFIKKWILKLFYISRKRFIFPFLRLLVKAFTNVFFLGLFFIFIGLLVFSVFNALVFSTKPEIDGLLLIVSAHGFFGDVIIFSLISLGLILVFDHKRKIRDLRDKLDDFSAWNTEEAYFRKAGIIKALARRGGRVRVLKGMTIKAVSLEKSNFKRATIEHCCLENCDLSFSDFRRSKINLKNPGPAIFKKTVLSYCRFNEAFIRSVDFSNLKMNNVNFTHAFLKDVQFRNCELQHSIFREVDMEAPDFSNSDLYRTNMSYSKMPGIIFSLNEKELFKNSQSARLHHGNFQFSVLNKGCFSRCDAGFSTFYAASLEEVDFFSADLSHCDFNSAYLVKADFTDANLREASFEDADLRGANMKKVRNLELWQLEKVRSLYQASLDDSLILKLKQKGFSHLFEFPKTK